MKFCVYNCSEPRNIEAESDVYVDYRDGIDSFFSGDKMLKKCISWHSIPASLGTEFFVHGKKNSAKAYSYDGVLLLIKNDLDYVFPILEKFKALGRKVGVAFHENGNYFSSIASSMEWLEKFKKICDSADFYWNLNMCHGGFFDSILNVPVVNCLHAGPYEWNHGFTVPFEDRKDIVLMTRTLVSTHLKRNTWYALGAANSVAREHDCLVSYLSEDVPTKVLQEKMEMFGLDRIRVYEGPLSYEEWLKFIARHRVGFHLDNSETLGQVVTDAALVGVPVVGGQTENNYIMRTDSHPGVAKNMLSECYKEEVNMSLVETALPEYKKITSLESLKEMHMKMFEGLWPKS